ncbi:MAG: SPFH domain-containing protein [Pyrinomonadaceae bacterium]
MARMNKVKTFAVMAIMALVVGCTKVPSGYVGVKVNMLGSEKGVAAQQVGPGRYFLTPNEEIFQFPTFNQNWDLGTVTFQTREGMKVSAPVGATIRADAAAAPMLFQTYRKGMDEIVGINASQVIRNQFNTKASKVAVESVYGSGKEGFLRDVENAVREHFKPYGIVVESIYLTGDIGLPPQVTTALNAKIEATQKAQQRENEVQQTIAEANKAREEAKGIADSMLLRAEAEAQALSIRGKALRENPGVVELNAIERWDGKLPIYMGSGPTPFLNISK